ncbi:MAG TPA: enoyl-CoA hydratase, partial [Cupriavidus sp.]|nr:enoyl-CoA hydratase [Cupriavidus sp.]
HKVDSRAIQSRGQSDDAKEGIASFLEKRPAQFPNRVSSQMPDFFDWQGEPDFE